MLRKAAAAFERRSLGLTVSNTDVLNYFALFWGGGRLGCPASQILKWTFGQWSIASICQGSSGFCRLGAVSVSNGPVSVCGLLPSSCLEIETCVWEPSLDLTPVHHSIPCSYSSKERNAAADACNLFSCVKGKHLSRI